MGEFQHLGNKSEIDVIAYCCSGHIGKTVDSLESMSSRIDKRRNQHPKGLASREIKKKGCEMLPLDSREDESQHANENSLLQSNPERPYNSTPVLHFDGVPS